MARPQAFLAGEKADFERSEKDGGSGFFPVNHRLRIKKQPAKTGWVCMKGRSSPADKHGAERKGLS